jgi:hypothetical protein
MKAASHKAYGESSVAEAISTELRRQIKCGQAIAQGNRVK